MAKNIMIMGTMSSAGKSYIVTGLCRYYTRLGLKVAPFKSQNMALNSYITNDGLEIGRAQAVQAFACNKEPSVSMNPILLKPTTDVGSQVIVEGKPIGNMKAAEYFEYKRALIPNILDAYSKLSEENDLIIIEGAGSPAEINLRENDIVNMGLAELLDANVLLVGDIDPGGVFAQLVGTIELLSDDEKNRIKGLIINKFRGDVELLKPGIRMLEDKCGKDVLGVVKMSNAKIEEEDSITCAFKSDMNRDITINVAIIKLPRISNFTDFAPLRMIESVAVSYVSKPSELLGADLIIIPGTKSTISDLAFMRESGLFECIKGLSVDVPVLGICGGFQMLGNTISDPEMIEGGGLSEGLGLIDMDTVYRKDKILNQGEYQFNEIEGFFSVLNGLTCHGYELHNGHSDIRKMTNPNVYGTYIHGLFEKKEISGAIIEALKMKKGYIRSEDTMYCDYNDYRNKQYDIIADELERAIDFDKLNKIIGL